MKITIEHNDTTATIESPEITAIGLVEMFLRCAVGAGFHSESIIDAMDSIADPDRVQNDR